jgi:hypothetical protein
MFYVDGPGWNRRKTVSRTFLFFVFLLSLRSFPLQSQPDALSSHKQFKSFYREGKKIFYDRLNNQLSILPLSDSEQAVLLLEGKKSRGIYEHLMNFYIIARKPQAFKPGDEWHPERNQRSWRSGGKSGIIWLWPAMPQDPIQNIGFNIIWYGYLSTEKEY